MTPIDDFYTLPPDEARATALRRYVEQKADMDRLRAEDEPTVPWELTDADRALLYKLRLSPE